MLTKTEPPQGDGLAYPFAEAPATGAFIEVAPGILWIRIPLPFRLDHVNIYLIEDGDGWAVLDTGIANQATRDVWEGLVAGPLAGRRLTRLIVTHFHPDHIGLAGWLCERFGIDPAHALMVDDMARNLKPAKMLGMTTVWVDNGSERGNDGVEDSFIDHRITDVGEWLETILKDDA